MARWLDDDEQRAWRGLLAVHADVLAALEAELEATHQLTEGEYAVLVRLSESPDRRQRMCDLAASLHLSASGLTRRLDGLVDQGFVTRQPSADDRRAAFAVLTDAGMAKLREAAPDHVAGVRRHLFDHLTKAQVRQLGDAFAAVREGRVGGRASA